MRVLKHQEIENYCKSFLKENYNLELDISVNVNSRMINTLGAFDYNGKTNTPIKLEFSKKFFENGIYSDKINVIKHECIHYALFILGKPYSDGDPYFESEIKKHNSCSTHTITFKTERNVRVYSCECQEHVFMQIISAKVCTRCNRRLYYIGRRKQLI